MEMVLPFDLRSVQKIYNAIADAQPWVKTLNVPHCFLKNYLRLCSNRDLIYHYGN